MWLSVPPVTSRAPRLRKPVGQRLGVVGDALGVLLERRLTRLGQRDGLGGHHVGQRAAEHHRAALVDGAGVLLGGQHQAAARAAQRLVRRRGGDVRVGHRILVAGEHLARDQTGEVRHVDHQRGADLVGDLAHLGEVHPARVGRVAGHQDQRLELARGGGDGGVVEQPGLGVGAVAALVEHLAGDVRPEAVGEVAARIERHPEQPLVAELGAQALPVRLRQVVDVLGAELGQAGCLDAGGQDGPVRDEVGVDARVRLGVGVGRPEQLAGVFGGEGLDGVDVLAARVEAVPDGALGVLVGEPGAHGQQHRGRRVVLAGDQLERITLVGKLFARRRGDPRFDGLDDLERGSVRGARGVGVLGAGRGGGGHGGSAVMAQPNRCTTVEAPYSPSASTSRRIRPANSTGSAARRAAGRTAPPASRPRAARPASRAAAGSPRRRCWCRPATAATTGTAAPAAPWPR